MCLKMAYMNAKMTVSFTGEHYSQDETWDFGAYVQTKPARSSPLSCSQHLSILWWIADELLPTTNLREPDMRRIGVMV